MTFSAGLCDAIASATALVVAQNFKDYVADVVVSDDALLLPVDAEQQVPSSLTLFSLLATSQPPVPMEFQPRTLTCTIPFAPTNSFM